LASVAITMSGLNGVLTNGSAVMCLGVGVAVFSASGWGLAFSAGAAVGTEAGAVGVAASWRLAEGEAWSNT